jgi:hypothetical protein
VPDRKPGQQIQLGELTLTNISRSGDALSAATNIAGVPHNVTLVRVKNEADENCTQVPVDDPDGFFALFEGADPGADGPFLPIKVPVLPGDWVLLISPFCD